MAKTKIDFKSLEIPAAAKAPLYAGVGAGDLAVIAVKDYVADVQKKVADVQKTVTDFDAKKLRDSALEQAKARRSAIEARVADLQAEALALPTKSQSVAIGYVGTVTDTFTDLAKRGEALVRGTKLPSTATVEVKVNTTNPAATKGTRKPARKTAIPVKSTATKSTTAKKAPAKKAPATKAPAKKAATTAKKAAPASTSSSSS
jgi:hypothetical protein